MINSQRQGNLFLFCKVVLIICLESNEEKNTVNTLENAGSICKCWKHTNLRDSGTFVLSKRHTIKLHLKLKPWGLHISFQSTTAVFGTIFIANMSNAGPLVTIKQQSREIIHFQ